ncbi:MAG: hypothetical protein AB7G12_05150 [Thermoanaerobaculia bacterium]
MRRGPVVRCARPARIPIFLVAALAVAGATAVSAIEPPPGSRLPESFGQATADFAAGNFPACRLGFLVAAQGAERAGLAARAYYGSACCAALAGRSDEAFDALALAVANGYREVERATIDPRLASLYGDLRWSGFLRQVEEQQQAYRLRLDPELLALYEEAEQANDPRNPGTPDAAAAEARRERALAFVDKGRIRHPGDAFRAAAILVESPLLENVARARALAHRALELDPDLLEARPLYAQALDREKLLAGEPQVFGTQLVSRDGRWAIYDCDPATTDADRAAWGVPSLDELRRRGDGLPPPAPPAAPTPPSAAKPPGN